MIATHVFSTLIIGRYSILSRMKLKPVRTGMICLAECCMLAKTQKWFFWLIISPAFVPLACVKLIRKHQFYNYLCINNFVQRNTCSMFLWLLNINFINIRQGFNICSLNRNSIYSITRLTEDFFQAVNIIINKELLLVGLTSFGSAKHDSASAYFFVVNVVLISANFERDSSC